MTGYNIANELIRCYEGEPWHGPNLKTILAGLTPQRAATKPIPTAHSAWEILLHMDAWNQVILKRLDGEVCNEPPEDFPQPEAITDDAWSRACASFEKTLRILADRIRPMQSADLEEPIAGKGYHTGYMVNGAVLHLVYHSSQIAVLGKA